jgi:hypothetical protein
MKKAIILLVLIIFSVSVQAQPQTPSEKWLQDYEAMKKYMAEAYSNFEWARKKIDLVALDKKTTEDLKKASSEAEAQQAVINFLKAFKDGHLSVRSVKPSSSTPNQTETSAFAPDAPSDKVCSALGYKLKMHKFSLPFEAAPNFRPVSTNKDFFPAGIFTLENGKSFAVLNIGLFSTDGFLGNCTQAWEEFRARLTAPCDEKCQERFNAATEIRLTNKLIEQIKALQAQKPDYLIVDIGGNGGGSNWVEVAARVISPKPLRRLARGFIRHPHWIPILEGDLKIVQEDLARKDLTAKQKSYLKTAKELFEKYIREAKSPCDRMFFWTTNEERAGCTLLNTTPIYSGGIFDNLPANEIANLKSKDVLIKSDAYEYEKHVFKGNLIVLVDRKTASAAELFASSVQASKSGAVVGEKTLGAGCGYVNGGTQYFLPVSKLQFRMPDCVRYRADGVNEVEGIEPDVSLWEAEDEKPKKLEKLLAHLSKMR